MIEISAVPVALAMGESVTVRFPTEPPRTIPLFSTSDVFDELAVNVRLPAAVSVSLIVNAIGATLVLTRFVTFAMGAMTGRRFTVAVNVRATVLLAALPSFTVTVIMAEPETPVSAETFSDPVALGLV